MNIKSIDVNGRINPIGIDDTKPVFHFTAECEKGEILSALRIVVKKGGEIVWDTGKKNYEGNNFIKYAGKTLEPKSKYSVALEIWEEEDERPASKVVTSFESAFLGSAWMAKWIEPKQENAISEKEISFEDMISGNLDFGGGEARLRRPKLIKKKFFIENDIVCARIYASAHGVYKIKCNGEEISQRRLAPETSAYKKQLYYQTYLAESFLKKGENELEIYLADGWWIGRVGLSGDSCNYGDRLAFIMQLELTYADGSKEIIASDDSFVSNDCKIEYSDLFIGEKWDNTFEPDKEDENVEIADFDMSNLEAQPTDPIVPICELETKEIFYDNRGDLILDFGKVFAGVLRIEIKANSGDAVTFEHSEVLDKDGNFINNILGRNKDQKDVLVCKEGTQVFEPAFTYHGFRYVRVKGISKENIISAKGIMITSAMVVSGTFSCDNEDINQLQRNIATSAASNFISIPTDCPQREKMGWTGDIQVFAKTGSFLFDLRAFLSAWLKNLRLEQYESGEVPIIIPNLPKQEKTQMMMSGCNSSAGWSDACILVPCYLYNIYGDIEILKENFDAMKLWLSYVENKCNEKKDNKFLWDNQFHFGDWLIPSLRELPDGVAIGTKETSAIVGSAFYAISTEAFINVCKVLKDNSYDISDEYIKSKEELLENIRNAIAKEYVKEDGSVGDSKLQGLYVMVLKSGAVSGKLKEKLVKKLVDIIKEDGFVLNTGFSSVSYLLDILYENGEKEAAYKLLFQKKAPSWLYMVEKGATSIWENWCAIKPDGEVTNSSYNHYAFGCVGDFIYRHIGGIIPMGAGYKKVLLKPDYDIGINSADSNFKTSFGNLKFSWKLKDNSLEIAGEIPPGIEANAEICNKIIKLTPGRFKEKIELIK